MGTRGVGTEIALGVDIGGTKILAGVVDATGAVLESARVDTPRTFGEPLADAVAGLVASFGSLPDEAPIGIAMAGRVHADGRVVAQSANLGLTDAPFADWLESRVDRSCRIINDADAALVAEYSCGAARGVRDVVMITVGTGVGGSAIAGGRLLTGAHGAATEAGHMVVKLGGRKCGCGGRGCLDQYGSGRALARYAAVHHRESGVQEAIARDLADAARSGHGYALGAFDELGMWLGRGIANVIALLDPARVVFAGGVAATGAVFLGAVERHLDTELDTRGVPARPELCVGALGEEAGMIGAALMANPFATATTLTV